MARTANRAGAPATAGPAAVLRAGAAGGYNRRMVARDRLADVLVETWAQQARAGFLLSDPDGAADDTRSARDPACGVRYRFRWLPHREIRGDVAELERRGILSRQRDDAALFRDPRDPLGRHCFLCAANIRACHPREVLVPLRLAGEDYLAGANFAWIERDHFTVMPVAHVDQACTRHVLEAMVDLHAQTAGRFRVLFNGAGAGATIPWHRHYQITTCPLPIEDLPPGREGDYPTLVQRLAVRDLERAHAAAADWLGRDLARHTLNVVVAGPPGRAEIFLFPRDRCRPRAVEKELVGGFEVAGDFVFSAASEAGAFRGASAELARAILAQVRPDA